MIVGTGRTGQSVARYLRARDEAFVFADEFPERTSLSGELAGTPVLPLSPSSLERAERVVVSPGVPLDRPALKALPRARLTNDIELFMTAAAAPVVGITGSNGKSTVTTLVATLAGAGFAAVRAGGNLGTPALDLLTDEVGLYVLELSSYQLELAASLPLEVAAIVSLSPDHLDRYDSIESYYAAKANIIQSARAVVLSRDLPAIAALAGCRPLVTFGAGEPRDHHEFGLRRENGATWLARGSDNLIPVDELPVMGEHNHINVLAALAIGTTLGLKVPAMLGRLADYQPLPHRSELVRRHAGVAWINDSKATNVGATCAAIQGLGGHGNLVVLLGGEGKGADFAPLLPLLRDHAKHCLLLGKAAPALKELLDGVVTNSLVTGLDEAVAMAASVAAESDIVLLSPACASTDMFRDFVDRGEQFRDLVEALP